MRIAMIDPGAVTPFYNESLCSALATREDSVELYTAPFLYHPLPEQPPFPRIYAFSRGLTSSSPWSQQASLRRLTKALHYPFDWFRFSRTLRQNPPQVIHLQWSLSPTFETHFLARLKATGIPLVVSAHNAQPHPGEPTSRRGWRALWTLADRLIVPSHYTKNEIGRLIPGLSTPRTVIPLGHHEPWIEKLYGRGEARRRLAIPESTPLALFYGLLKPYKGLSTLVEAFHRCRKKLPTAQLALCGAPRIPLGPLQESLADRNLQDVHCRFDYLSLEESQLWFEAADLVVLPYDNASQSMIPAMAYTFARPVVATAVGAFPEQVISGRTGALSPAQDPQALADHLSDLLADREKCERMGMEGRRHARQFWGWDDIAQATSRVYREVVS